MFVWLVIAAIVYVVGTVVMPERVPRLAQLPAPTAGTVLLVSACNHADVHLALHGRSWYQDGWWWKESPHRKTVPCPTKAAAKPNA